MIKPDFIIRSNRRTLSLTISRQGELIVRAPKKLPLDYIINFVQEKEKWINSKKKQIETIYTANAKVLNYEKFLVLGKVYSKTEISKIKKVEVHENVLFFPKCNNIEAVIQHAINFYKQLTSDILKERVEYFANLMQVDYESISVTNSKNRWGSCDIKGNIKFNLRLAMLPHKTIDYIIIHELAHLIEFNHSKNFYKIIESIMPSYKRQITHLKSNNFILQLLRF